MNSEPWFRATWFSYLPVNRKAWVLTLGLAAFAGVLAGGGLLMMQETGDVRWVVGSGLAAFTIIAAFFAFALTRTDWSGRR